MHWKGICWIIFLNVVRRIQQRLVHTREAKNPVVVQFGKLDGCLISPSLVPITWRISAEQLIVDLSWKPKEESAPAAAATEMMRLLSKSKGKQAKAKPPSTSFQLGCHCSVLCCPHWRWIFPHQIIWSRESFRDGPSRLPFKWIQIRSSQQPRWMMTSHKMPFLSLVANIQM